MWLKSAIVALTLMTEPYVKASSDDLSIVPLATVTHVVYFDLDI